MRRGKEEEDRRRRGEEKEILRAELTVNERCRLKIYERLHLDFALQNCTCETRTKQTHETHAKKTVPREQMADR